MKKIKFNSDNSNNNQIGSSIISEPFVMNPVFINEKKLAKGIVTKMYDVYMTQNETNHQRTSTTLIKYSLEIPIKVQERKVIFAKREDFNL